MSLADASVASDCFEYLLPTLAASLSTTSNDFRGIAGLKTPSPSSRQRIPLPITHLISIASFASDRQLEEYAQRASHNAVLSIKCVRSITSTLSIECFYHVTRRTFIPAHIKHHQGHRTCRAVSYLYLGRDKGRSKLQEDSSCQDLSMPMPQTSTAAEPTRSFSRTSPSFFQRLGDIDLFNNLLFNREKVYQSLRRVSPVRTSAKKEEKGPVQSHKVENKDSHPVVWSIEPKAEGRDSSAYTSMLSYVKGTDMAVSNPRGRPPKRAPAKAKPKGKPSLITTRKRSSPATSKTERASKVRKMIPKANSGKRVNGRGDSIADAFVVSDDDDDDDDFVQPRQESRTESLTPPRQMIKVDSPSSENDLKPVLIRNNNLQDELVHIRAMHEKELEQLHRQLCASEAKAKLTKEDAKEEVAELQRRHGITSDKQMADLDEIVEAERRQSSDLSWECSHLRRELEEAGSRLVGEAEVIRERDAYQRLYKEEQNINADLMQCLTQKDAEAARKATAAAEDRQQLVAQMQDLQREVAQLKDENAALKAVSSSQSMETDANASPAPSQSSTTTNAEQRLANVRKTYVTVKRRYDSLHAVATNLSLTTHAWDYGNFGEFGRCLRQLKAMLDENGQESLTGGLGGSVAKVE